MQFTKALRTEPHESFLMVKCISLGYYSMPILNILHTGKNYDPV